ncbi:neurofilament medium polypeptide isoform X2 [Cololabis saira]|uniref:neurofilament medium polypeptide isoform X2 n=1 Tax=Cololabis saira TaxID=129043 RepID=UPI002AD1D702|nr:neurofilament medium polypeptide isoform X2 [Cololabis saira]
MLCILERFMVVLLIQHCTSQDVPSPSQSSTEATYQGNHTLSQQPERPAAETVPLLSPPTLKDVQQAVQEASEQVEGRGAEEVLKELLERVIEAALGQAEGRSEAEDAEDTMGTQTRKNEAETGAEMLEQPVTDRNMSLREEENGFAEMEGVDAAEAVTGESKGVIEVSMKSIEDVETEVSEAGGLEVINDSLGMKLSQGDMEETLEETEDTVEAGEEDNIKKVVLSVEKNETTKEIADEEEIPATVEVTVRGQPEQGTVEASESSLGVADDNHIGNEWKKDDAQQERTYTEGIESETTELPSDKYEIKTKSVLQERSKAEEEAKIGEDAHEPEKGVEYGYLEKAGTEEGVEAEGTDLGGATGDERYGDDVIKEQSATLVEKKKKAGEEKQTAVEDPHDTDKEDGGILVVSGLQPVDGAEASTEESPESQPPTTSPSPSLDEQETGENTVGIVRHMPDLLPHDPGLVQPTQDHCERLVLAEHPQAEEEPGEANELMDDITGTREINERNIEPWKIGAILAAVFLVLETVVIIVYILKFRKKKSTPALTRTCEEGCVGPEAATGGSNKLPAGNGDSRHCK